METPSSARLTNSIQVSRKIENSEKNRCALMDLTNDSPIVGLADGGNVETRSAKKRRERRVKNTPGSGEALLRCQVKTLLQKVEEEASDILSPATVTPSILIQPQPIHQVVNEEDCESEKSVITRSLFMDFSEDSQVSDASEKGSVVCSCCSIKKLSVTTEDDDSSVWSMQVNAKDNEEEEEEYEDEEITEDDEEEEEEEEYEEGRLLLDELCEGLNNITVNERIVPKFEGKHTRFVYNSDDDELVKEEEQSASPNILCLKGLPTPKGKHLRFSEEEE